MSTEDRTETNRSVELSERHAYLGYGWALVTVIGGVVTLVILRNFSDIPEKFFPCLMAPLLVSLVVAYYVGRAWLATRWQRVANRPMLLLSKGKPDAAEKAHTDLLARAAAMNAGDPRRGILLQGAGAYLYNVGRTLEALPVLEQSLAILTPVRQRESISYMAALQDYSQILIEAQEYERAQTALQTCQDWIPVAKKTLGDTLVIQCDEWELNTRIGLAYLFLHMNALPEADRQLREASAFLPRITTDRRTGFQVMIVGLGAQLQLALGKPAEAWADCEMISHATAPLYLEVRAKVCVARQDFAQAERLLRERFALFWPGTSMHQPALLSATLDLAEALFGQDKIDDAFRTLQQARSIVADCQMPRDATWRKTLATWLERARDRGRPERTSIEAELAHVAATPLQAIMVLEKFRVQSQAST